MLRHDFLPELETLLGTSIIPHTSVSLLTERLVEVGIMMISLFDVGLYEGNEGAWVLESMLLFFSDKI
jgi:hypothetical protein